MVENRVVLVTGAGRRRIGNVVAHDLANAGMRIAIHYHRSAESAQETVRSIAQAGGHAHAFPADLRSTDEAGRLVREVEQTLGGLDVLVCTSALWSRKRLEETTGNDLQAHWELNAKATFVCCQQAGLLMARQARGGCIVTIGDWATVRPYADYSAYFLSKGSIPTLTRTLAVELAERNPSVRVNAILPGPVMLPEDLPEQERRQVVAATLLKREGRPEHIAQAVRFLIDNDYVTGVCLPVDGGRSIYAGGW